MTRRRRLTTVGVEEGQVEVFPENEALQSVTLTANQQVQVSDKKVIQGGIETATVLLYVGIGVGSLIGLIVLILIIYAIYRLLKRSSRPPVVSPAGLNVAPRPPMLRRERRQPGGIRCPNPQCRAVVPGRQNFCGACGSQLS